MAMPISKFLGFLLLGSVLFSSKAAQSPASAPLSGVDKRISPVPSPSPIAPASPTPSKTPTPKSSVAPPPSPSQSDSPSTANPPGIGSSSISDSPVQAPGPSENNAISNQYTGFGSVAVMICAAVLAI